VIALLAAIAATLAVIDFGRAPADQLTNRVLIRGVRLYRVHLSPLLSLGGVRCRLVPSCSRYSEEALRQYGAIHGGWLTLCRLARCGPWTAIGTVDPPPARGDEAAQ
jgi:putative membrane protein insertion efficiency factor